MKKYRIKEQQWDDKLMTFILQKRVFIFFWSKVTSVVSPFKDNTTVEYWKKTYINK